MAKENQLDAEYIEATLATPGWTLIQAKLDAAFAGSFARLKTAEGNEVYRCQGEIKAYEVVKSIPRIIQAEARK